MIVLPTYDFVQQSDALHAFVDVLGVEVGQEVGDGGEEDAGVAPALRVQILREREREELINQHLCVSGEKFQLHSCLNRPKLLLQH